MRRVPTYLVIEASLLDHGDEDVVGLASDLNSLLGDVTEDADGNARTGEGVAVHKRLVNAELSTDGLCLVSIRVKAGGTDSW